MENHEKEIQILGELFFRTFFFVFIIMYKVVKSRLWFLFSVSHNIAYFMPTNDYTSTTGPKKNPPKWKR